MSYMHCLAVQYNGEWTDVNGIWKYEPGAARCFLLKEGEDTKLQTVLKKLHELTKIDESSFDIVIRVSYSMQAVNNIPVIIKSQGDFDYFLHRSKMTPLEPIPLCISVIQKEKRLRLPVKETVNSPLQITTFHAQDIVPELRDDEEHFSPTIGGEIEQVLCVSAITANAEHGESSTQKKGRRRVAPRVTFQSVETESSKLGGQMGQNWVNGLGPYTTFEVGYTFKNKMEIKMTAQRYAIANHFTFKTFKSNPDLYVLKCKCKPELGNSKACTWNLRAVRLEPSQVFQVRTYVREHTCSILESTFDNKQATALIIGDTLKNKYQSHKTPHPPRKLMDDVKDIFGLDISYSKGWKSVEAALTFVRGTVEDSYASLPSYLYMLQMKNEGTVTHLEVDEDGSFRYMFMAFGVAIRGFRCSIRPVLCVDACHIKHKCGGHMLIAIAIDSNEQLYPVAIGVVDGENNLSWDYFMKQLRGALGQVRDMVFVSDRHKSIARGLINHFPDAHHGACIFHLKKNIITYFKTNACNKEFEWAAKSAKVPEFERHFAIIEEKNSGVAEYLKEIRFHAWSRAYFSGIRYDFMTSNYAESFNALCNNARRFPITTMLDWIRKTVSIWFANRKEDAAACQTTIATNYDDELKKSFEKAIHYDVVAYDRTEFEVLDGSYKSIVDLERKTCSCREFQLRGLPCTHAIAAARKGNVKVADLCSKYYTTNCWAVSYSETIHPPGDEEDWNVPQEIKDKVCLKPKPKVKKVGRPCEKRKLSRAEGPKKQKKCTSCERYGHNRTTCDYLQPAPSTRLLINTAHTQ